MTIRRGISEIQGIQDEKVAQILREIKAILEAMTGRMPNRAPIKHLGAAATLSGVINKVNEIIIRIQEE